MVNDDDPLVISDFTELENHHVFYRQNIISKSPIDYL